MGSKGFHRIRVTPVALSKFMWDKPYYALGCVTSYVRHHNAGALNEYFLIRQVDLWEPDTVHKLVEQAKTAPPGIYLLSCYVWNFDCNMDFARKLKEVSPQSLFVVGGPHVPRATDPCTTFFEEHPYIDLAIRGEGEITLASLLESLEEQNWPANKAIDLSDVSGLTWNMRPEGVASSESATLIESKKIGSVVRTAERARVKDLAIFPSPYLTGEYSNWFKPGTVNQMLMVLETNRGCPYGCTFCDWGAATLQKINKFSMERIKGEIDYLFSNKVNAMFCSDANFGVFERDVEIAQALADAQEKYHTSAHFQATYAKHPTEKLARIIKIFHDAKLAQVGCISMQSRDLKVLNAIDRSNIKPEKYENLMAMFNKEKLQMSSELMIGLPEQTYDSYRSDLQYFFDHKVTAQTYTTTVMPNAPMADPDYVREFGIKTNENREIISTSAMSQSDYEKMISLYLLYQLMVKRGVGRYLLYFLQLEHQIKGMDLLDAWLDAAINRPEEFPLIKWTYDEILNIDMDRKDALALVWGRNSTHLFHNLDEYYNEIVQLAREISGKEIAGSGLDTVIKLQKAVMPHLEKTFPYTTVLAHNFLAWYDQLFEVNSLEEKPENFKTLESFPPTEFEIPEQSRKWRHLSFAAIHTFGDDWELKTALSLF